MKLDVYKLGTGVDYGIAALSGTVGVAGVYNGLTTGNGISYLIGGFGLCVSADIISAERSYRRMNKRCDEIKEKLKRM